MLSSLKNYWVIEMEKTRYELLEENRKLKRRNERLWVTSVSNPLIYPMLAGVFIGSFLYTISEGTIKNFKKCLR